MTPSTLMRRTVAATCGLLMLSTIVPASAQDTLEEARARREALAQEAAAAAGEIDVLEAEDAEIVAALEQIDSWIGTQKARLERAELDLVVTIEAEEQARTRAAELGADIVRLREIVTEQSVTAYIEGFASEDEILLGATDINSVPMLRFVLDETSGISADATDQLRVALDGQQVAIAEAEEAGAAAIALQNQINAQIDDLEANRQTQEELRLEIDRRIEELQDTTAVLAAEDVQIEEFIRAEVARLAALEEERRRAAARQAEEERLADEERQAAEEAAQPEGDEPEPAPEAGGEEAPDPAPESDGDETALPEEPSADDSEDGSADAPEDSGEDDADNETGDEGDAADEAVDETDGDVAQEPEPEPTPAPNPDGVPSFRRPVPGAMTSGYGNRIHPVYGTQRLHTGIDFNGGQGTPIGAAAAGTVIFVDAFAGYGNTVIVQHSGGYTSLYAHMSGFNTGVGASVAAGDTIGFIGSTGLSTGPHLHFEIRLNGGAIDPAPFL